MHTFDLINTTTKIQKNVLNNMKPFKVISFPRKLHFLFMYPTTLCTRLLKRRKFCRFFSMKLKPVKEASLLTYH